MDRQQNQDIKEAYRSINGLATSKQCPRVAGCGTADGPGQGWSLRMSPAGPTPATLPWLSVHSCRVSCGAVVLQAHPHFAHEKPPGRELTQSTTGRRQPGLEHRTVERAPSPAQPQGPKRRRGTDPVPIEGSLPLPRAKASGSAGSAGQAETFLLSLGHLIGQQTW